MDITCVLIVLPLPPDPPNSSRGVVRSLTLRRPDASNGPVRAVLMANPMPQWCSFASGSGADVCGTWNKSAENEQVNFQQCMFMSFMFNKVSFDQFSVRGSVDHLISCGKTTQTGSFVVTRCCGGKGRIAGCNRSLLDVCRLRPELWIEKLLFVSQCQEWTKLTINDDTHN